MLHAAATAMPQRTALASAHAMSQLPPVLRPRLPRAVRYATGIQACLPMFCANGRAALGGASAAMAPQNAPVDCRCKAGLPLAGGET
jgi:hypothetical protein